MIPHKTISLRPRDIFYTKEEMPENPLGNYIQHPHFYWLGSARYGLQKIVKGRVAVPAFTCHVVKDAIIKAGATPVFFDSGVVADVEEFEKIANRVDMVLLPYNFGFMPNMKELLRVCKRHDVELVEDCALALGSTYDGKLAGSYSNRAVWSFNLSKNMGFIGGLVSSDDILPIDSRYDYPKSLMFKTILEVIIAPVFFHPWVYTVSRFLLKGLLSQETPALEYGLPLNAMKIIYKSIERYPEVLELRRKNAEFLIKELDGVIDFIKPEKLCNPSWQNFVMMSSDREKVMKGLLKEGVEVFPWHTYKDLSSGMTKAATAEKEFMVFDTLRPQWQLDKFVAAVKKVLK